MANKQRAMVNQRLYFSRLHLQWLERELASEQLPANIVEQALGESLLFHLQSAYRTYLLELAESYVLYPDSLERAVKLQELLAEQGKSAAEVEQLCQLERGPSWLSPLLSALDRSVPLSHPGSGQGIAVVHVSSADSASLLETGRRCLAGLSELIEQQRGQLEEW